jgi:CxxC motif-containing protein
MSSNDSIESALGLRPISSAVNGDLPIPSEQQSVISVETIEPIDVDADETIRDIELARSNIKNIIEQGDDSLKEMIELAKQSESPRAFEVASGLMKTLLDANRDFVEMSMKKKYAKEEILKPKEEPASTTNVTNNNLILSTADLLKMLKGETE